MTSIANRRQLSVTFEETLHVVKGFRQSSWHISRLMPGAEGPHVLTLVLSMTERADYRFNLNASTPRLFVRAGHVDEPPQALAITASQTMAATWMDGEHRVLETTMPLAIQVWIEAYLLEHGEAPDEGRKKKRKGAGRAHSPKPANLPQEESR
uniref:DUF3305 domain-containing protein n=1 Tax=Halomonas sp. TaxID=1486246 RepID=UPI0026382552|nr:DUF3305 domain-containing protein [Halomonas sp.]